MNFCNLGPSTRDKRNAAHGQEDAPKVFTIMTPHIASQAINVSFTDFAKEAKSVVFGLGNRIFWGFVAGALILGTIIGIAIRLSFP